MRGFFRLIAIIFYDLLLLIAILFVATALALPFNAGEAFSTSQYFYPIYLIVISFLYYGWFWTNGGQTLGMKTWKVRIIGFNQKPLTWKQAAIRFIVAIVSWSFLGLGFFWKFINKHGYTWHDLASKSTLFKYTA